MHIVDGDLNQPKLPLIPGHEIIGRVVQTGARVSGLTPGMRVGLPWLNSTFGVFDCCVEDHENLCDFAAFTGYDINGDYAEYCTAEARYCFALDNSAHAAQLAPQLCAGLIGYRALRLAGQAGSIGIYGFDAAAHLLAQVANLHNSKVYAFTRSGDMAAQRLAMNLDCAWASGSNEQPPELLDAAIIFAPLGELVPQALMAVRKGGTLVYNGIRMSTIVAFEYFLLLGERVFRSVANLTRQDATEFLELARAITVVAQTTVFPPVEANSAIA